MGMSSDAEQEGFIRELSRDPHACVIYKERLVSFWTQGMDVSAKPLVRYIRQNFHTAFESDGYCLMVR